jgi:hypothetical protein
VRNMTAWQTTFSAVRATAHLPPRITNGHFVPGRFSKASASMQKK